MTRASSSTAALIAGVALLLLALPVIAQPSAATAPATNMTDLGEFMLDGIAGASNVTSLVSMSDNGTTPSQAPPATMRTESDTTTENAPLLPSGSPPPTTRTAGAEAEPASICPPGSTVDGVWVLNRPEFSTHEFYWPPSAQSRAFGRWIRGRRTAILPRVCRGQDPARDCEWAKPPPSRPPHSFPPFEGSVRFDVRTMAAYYTRSREQPATTAPSPPPLVGDTGDAAQATAPPPPTTTQQQRQEASSEPATTSTTTTNSSPPATWCYDFQSASHCLRNKIVLFIGDSHIVNHAQTLCRMVLGDTEPHGSGYNAGICGELDVRFLPHLTVVVAPRSNTTIALLRTRYDILAQMHRLDAHPWAAFLERAHFVVVARGMWDLVYKDTPRAVVASQQTAALKYIARRFKGARVIVKLLHYDHKWMWNCSNPDRLREMRDANICATYVAQEAVAQEIRALGRARRRAQEVEAGGDARGRGHAGGGRSHVPAHPDPYARFSVMDTYGMTRELPYGAATDQLGHHYEGSVIESLTQVLLSLMCPARPQNHTQLFASFRVVAKESCARILRAAGATRVPMCGCNDDLLTQLEPAKTFCDGFRASKHIVPFIVDS